MSSDRKIVYYGLYVVKWQALEADGETGFGTGLEIIHSLFRRERC